MEYGISHEWDEETLEAKTRWFSSLAISDRIAMFCAWYELAVSTNPNIIRESEDDDRSMSHRVQVLELT